MPPFDGIHIPADEIVIEALQRPQDERKPIQVQIHPERLACYETDGVIAGKFAASANRIVLFPQNLAHIEVVRSRLQATMDQFHGAGTFLTTRGAASIIVQYDSDTCREALGKDTPECPAIAQDICRAVKAKVCQHFKIG